MSAPQVYKAIHAVAAELATGGIAKRHRNERDDYLYRSIDDVLNRLAPLLAKHRLCVLPRVLERTSSDRIGEGDALLVSVTLKVAFDLVSTADASLHTIEAYGEALDSGDKATAKAMSAAYKQAMLQALCVPVTQIDDPDSSSHRLKRSTRASEPVEGWEQWTAGMIDIAASCVSMDALERLQQRQRPLLNALGRERPDLYASIGEAFTKRTTELAQRPGQNSGASTKKPGAKIGATEKQRQAKSNATLKQPRAGGPVREPAKRGAQHSRRTQVDAPVPQRA